MNRYDETYYPGSTRLQAARTVLRQLDTGQDCYGYRVQVDSRRPRYFDNEDGYNGNRAKEYLLEAFADDPEYRSEVLCFPWENWESR